MTHFRNYHEEMTYRVGALQLRLPLLTLGKRRISIVFELVYA
jgi:hypothetical protein